MPYDPETTDLPILDQFRGSEGLVRLSQRLMDWYDDPISDAEIGEVLGAELVTAFRYAQERLAGKVRKVTLEPAFCHSADVAIRAVELGYPDPVIMTCFLHDVVEDVCSTIADMPAAVADLAQRFPARVVHDVQLLTNRYQLIFNGAAAKVSKGVSMDRRGLRAFRAAIDVVRHELPERVAEQYANDFDQLARYLESDVDVSEAVKIARRDRKFTFATFLERKVYDLYVEDLIAGAAATTLASQGREPVNALVVKFMDLIDNVRTSEVSNRLSLFKLVSKAESVIDRTQRGFVDRIPAEVAVRTTIPTVHRIVQLRLVDQFKLRRRAIADNFSETRFASLVGFLAEHATRLEAKYAVPKERVAAITRLEDEVRGWNEARARGLT